MSSAPKTFAARRVKYLPPHSDYEMTRSERTGELFIVMALYEGETLKQQGRAKEGRLPRGAHPEGRYCKSSRKVYSVHWLALIEAGGASEIEGVPCNGQSGDWFTSLMPVKTRDHESTCLCPIEAASDTPGQASDQVNA